MSVFDFYLLRPWWLLALLPALFFFWQLLKQPLHLSRWTQAIDADLLRELLDNNAGTQQQWTRWFLLAGWILATLALSGPCFEKSNQAALKQADAVVIMLDLSPSMLVKDVTPSRLQAAHYKILDLLKQRKEGYTGLVAYSGTAHVVAPLSDDANTVAALVTTLEPSIMPVLGSQVEDAVNESLQLLQNSHFTHGRLLLISDGIAPEALANIHQQLRGKSIELHVIGVGTAQGGPVALQNGSFAKDDNGKIQTFPFQAETLQQLASENNGHYSALRTDDSDIAALLAPPSWMNAFGNGEQRNASHTIENWQDAGYWLALPCLLIVLVAFRRGMIVCLLPLLFLTAAPDSHALDLPAIDWHTQWQDLWQTPDQQGQAALARGDNKTAADQFKNPEWKAFAEYQNQQHDEAAKHFAESDSAAAHYNRGNALAHTPDLQGAINAYDEALKRNPDLADAKANRALVQKLLEQQQKKQQQKNQTSDQDSQQDKSSQDQQENEQENNQKDQQNAGEQKDDQQQQGEQDKQQPDGKPSEDGQQQQAQNPAEKNQPGDAEEQQNTSPQNNTQQDDSTLQDDKKQQDQKTAKQAEEQEQQNSQQQDDAKSGDSDKTPDDKQPESKTESTADSKTRADHEKQQAAEQWLRRVPDDPGGLLRNKFDYYYKVQQQQALRARRNNPERTEKEQRW